MKIGTVDIEKVYLGSSLIEKIYLGNNIIYDGGTTKSVTFNNFNDNLDVSVNDGTSQTITSFPTTIQVQKGDKIDYEYNKQELISGFSSSNYISPTFQFYDATATANSWEAIFHFQFKPSSNDAQVFYGRGGGYNSFMGIASNSKKFWMFLCNDTYGGNIACDIYGSTVLQENEWYYVKFAFTGTAYVIYLSATGEFNGEEIVENAIASSTKYTYADYPWNIGACWSGAYARPFAGTIDFAATKIIADGQVMFDGATAVKNTDYIINGTLTTQNASAVKQAYIYKDYTLTPTNDVVYGYSNNNDNLYSTLSNTPYIMETQQGDITYQKVGNPTIVDGVISNFSDNDYATFSQPFRPGNKPWKVKVDFETTDDWGLYRGILSKEGEVCFGIAFRADKYIEVTLSSNGTSLDIGFFNTTYALEDYTEYSVVVEFTGSSYIALIRKAGENYKPIGTGIIQSSTPIFDNDQPLNIGQGRLLNNNFRGSINLNNTYIEIDNQMWYGEQTRLTWANPNIYLQSTGTQYIDTGVIADNETGVSIKSSFIENNYSDNIVVGSRNNNQNTRFSIDYDWSNMGNITIGYNNYYTTSFSSVGLTTPGQTCIITLNFENDRSAKVNNILCKDLSDITLTQQTGSLYMFKWNYSSEYPYKGKIYNLQISQGNNIIKNFVPVPQGLVIGNYTVPSNGMFDIVNQDFYANAGTGNFTYGSNFALYDSNLQNLTYNTISYGSTNNIIVNNDTYNRNTNNDTLNKTAATITFDDFEMVDVFVDNNSVPYHLISFPKSIEINKNSLVEYKYDETTTVSGFSDSKYINIIPQLNTQNAFVMESKINLNSIGNDKRQTIFGVNNKAGLTIRVIPDGSLQANLGKTLDDYDIGSISGSTLSTNKDYWVRFTYDGTSNYNLLLSEDGQTFVPQGNTLTSEYKINSGNSLSIQMGDSHLQHWVLDGTIDLTKTYIKENNIYTFNGKTAVLGIDYVKVGNPAITTTYGTTKSFYASEDITITPTSNLQV